VAVKGSLVPLGDSHKGFAMVFLIGLLSSILTDTSPPWELYHHLPKRGRYGTLCMAIDPFARVISPMFWGGFLSMPLLAAIFSVMGIFGGYLITVVIIGVDAGAFWSQMQSNVDLRNDIVNGVIKSVVFGAAVTAIALFEGYDAPPTAEGVSHAVTRTVVTSALAVLALDFVLTAFMFTGV